MDIVYCLLFSRVPSTGTIPLSHLNNISLLQTKLSDLNQHSPGLGKSYQIREGEDTPAWLGLSDALEKGAKPVSLVIGGKARFRAQKGYKWV